LKQQDRSGSQEGLTANEAASCRRDGASPPTAAFVLALQQSSLQRRQSAADSGNSAVHPGFRYRLRLRRRSIRNFACDFVVRLRRKQSEAQSLRNKADSRGVVLSWVAYAHANTHARVIFRLMNFSFHVRQIRAAHCDQMSCCSSFEQFKTGYSHYTQRVSVSHAQ
jgi:hypothetical protein